VQEAHCPTCAAYEGRVIGRRPGEELPPDVKPCPAFAMSDRFRAWAVGEMRREVGGQLSAAGLDRMAIARLRRKEPDK
jgi:hypothetical protein